MPRKFLNYCFRFAVLTHANYDHGVGRGCGVGRGLGVALGVIVGVAVAVAVAVAVGVAEGVTVGVGLGVGVGPAVRLKAPILNRHPIALVLGTYSSTNQKVVSSVGSMSIAV